MSKFPDWDTKRKISMSQKVGGIIPFLKDTACVHLEQREMIAYCDAFIILFPEQKGFNRFLEKKATPALLRIGLGRWYRDQITDLGLALSQGGTGRQTEDTRGVLDEDEG